MLWTFLKGLFAQHSPLLALPPLFPVPCDSHGNSLSPQNTSYLFGHSYLDQRLGTGPNLGQLDPFSRNLEAGSERGASFHRSGCTEAIHDHIPLLDRGREEGGLYVAKPKMELMCRERQRKAVEIGFPTGLQPIPELCLAHRMDGILQSLCNKSLLFSSLA